MARSIHEESVGFSILSWIATAFMLAMTVWVLCLALLGDDELYVAEDTARQ